MKPRKAVIAVAGFGTRFLPATKVVPKELLPIVNKPVVQYLVEEAVTSGVTDIILVTRSGTQTVGDHFDSSRELEIHLEEQKKHDYADAVRAVSKMANVAVVRQGRHLPYGNGTPLLAARSFLDRGEPFVYMFGDDLVLSETPCVKQLIDVFVEHKPAAVIAFQDMPMPEATRYGLARLKKGTEPKELEYIVEKPSVADAPSTLAQLGRFVLPWRTIEILERQPVGKGNELWLTDANHTLCREGRVIAHQIEGTWYTTGDPLRYLIANVEYALRDREIGEEFAAYLGKLKLSKA
ncbi:MAG: UTP--glucose-1-phosphate uridylyltransferase [Pirellulales bacterium]|nr:UTP--glucose-1-phosphate uridylyltransferase [Pirellulales bacterium]